MGLAHQWASVTAEGPPPKADKLPTVAFVQAVTPHYRVAALALVLRRLPQGTVLLTGSSHFEESRRTDVRLIDGVSLVRNVFLLDRRILFQRGVWRSGLRADICVLDLNPRILSTWGLLLARRLLRRKSIVWGHVWPRAGRDSRTAFVRRQFRSLADAVITYTQSEARELLDEDSRAVVFTAPNALYPRVEIAAPTGGEESDFIYVGRLADDKHLPLLLGAIARLRDGGVDGKLTIVGDGPSREGLEAAVRNLSLRDRVSFAGEITDIECLRAHYAGAVASICPGPVGLALIQSLGFGVPMIFPREDCHGPEIEAARDGWNCVQFDAGSTESLAAAMRDVLRSQAVWRRRRAAISTATRSVYSAEAMAEGILSAIEAVSVNPRAERFSWRPRTG